MRRTPYFFTALILLALHGSASAQVAEAGSRVGVGGDPAGKSQLQRAELEKMKRQLRSLPPSEKKRELEDVLAEIERRIAERENPNPNIRFVELYTSASSDVETREYLNRFKARIEDCGSTHFPSDGQRSVYGRAVISIHINRDGTLKSTELLSSSKKEIVDRHALRIVQASAPFGKVPDALADDRYNEFVFSTAFNFHHDNEPPYVSSLPNEERCKWVDDESKEAATSREAASRAANGPVKDAARSLHDLEPSTRHSVNKPPIYPLESKRYGQQGRVVVKILVDVDGRASQAVVRESSGYPLLDKAAVDAVTGWSFVPGRRNGILETMEFNVPINFVLQ